MIKRNYEPKAESQGNVNSSFSNAFSKPRESVGEKEPSQKIIKIFDFVLRFSLFAIFLGIPLFFTSFSFQGIAFEKQMYFYFWTLIALVAWASKSGYSGEMKIRKTPLDIPILAFWLTYIAATVFSVDRWHSFFGFPGDPSRGLLNITAIIVVYYLILSNFDGKMLKWIFRGIIISGAIMTFWSLLAVLGIKIIPDSIAPFFPFSLPGSIESLPVFLGALIPILMVSILKIQENEGLTKGKKNIYSISMLIILAADLFLIFSLFAYTQWAGILTGIVLFLVFILSKVVRPKETWAIIPMGVFVLILIFLMIGQVNISKINLPLSVNVPYPTAFNIAKDSLKDSFFLGYGTANYGYAFSKNLPGSFNNMGVRFLQGQGIVLESAATIGAIGTVLLIILLLIFLGVALFMLSRDKEKNKLYSLGALAAAMIMLVNILMIRVEASVLIYGVLLMSLAVAILYFESNARRDFINFSLKASPKFALALAFIYLLIFASVVFLFVFFGKIYVADLKMGSALKESKISEEGSIAKIVMAININPREGKYFTRLGQEYMTLTNQEMIKEEREKNIEKIQNYLTLAIQASKRGEELMKNDVTTVEALAQIYDNAGLYVGDALALAEEKYSRAEELEPGNPDLLVKIGQIKLKIATQEKNDTEKKRIVEESKDVFQRAADLRKNYAPAYYNLALTQEALGDLDKAIENMSSAVSFQKNSLNYVFNLARLYQSRNKGDDTKTAEGLYKQILGVNDKEINAHFNLALLYEKNDKNGEAVEELRKVLELLPEGSDQAKSQIDKMISNIQNGIENTAENLGIDQPQVNAPEESAPQE